MHATFCFLIRSKVKPIDYSFAHVFGASRKLHVFTLSFDWLTGLPVPFMIGHWQSDWQSGLAFNGLSHSIENRPYRG